MHVSAVKVSLTAADSARSAISTSWSMPNDTSWLSVRYGPTMCARPSAWRTSGAASGGQTVANRCPCTMKCPGRYSRLITASASVASRTRSWSWMYCRYPLTGASSTAPSASVRATSSVAVGPSFGCGSGVAAALLLDRVGQVSGDARDHLGQLDRDGRVVDEVDEHGQVDDHQRRA